MAINRARLSERHDTVPNGSSWMTASSRRSVHLIGLHEVTTYFKVWCQIQHHTLQGWVVQQVPIRERGLASWAELVTLLQCNSKNFSSGKNTFFNAKPLHFDDFHDFSFSEQANVTENWCSWSTEYLYIISLYALIFQYLHPNFQTQSSVKACDVSFVRKQIPRHVKETWPCKYLIEEEIMDKYEQRF